MAKTKQKFKISIKLHGKEFHCPWCRYWTTEWGKATIHSVSCKRKPH